MSNKVFYFIAIIIPTLTHCISIKYPGRVYLTNTLSQNENGNYLQAECLYTPNFEANFLDFVKLKYEAIIWFPARLQFEVISSQEFTDNTGVLNINSRLTKNLEEYTGATLTCLVKFYTNETHWRSLLKEKNIIF
jgi:hypothetical protein